MVRYENDCNCCETCRGCGLKHVSHIYCDCGCEVSGNEKLYHLSGTEQWLCKEHYDKLVESMTETILADSLLDEIEEAW